VTPHTPGKSTLLARSDGLVRAASAAFATDAPPPETAQRTILTRVVPKHEVTEGKAEQIGRELRAQGMANGLRHFTEAEVIERPMGNRKGGVLVCVFRVYGS